MPVKIKIAWIQGKDQGNRESNIQYYLDKARQLKDVNLIVFPEVFFDNYFPIVEDNSFFELALEETDQKIQEFSKLAQEKKSVVVVPFFEKAGDKFYNTVIVFEKDGKFAGKYRKMHIPYEPDYYEKTYFSAGDLGFEPIKTSVGILGVMICWDQWFPEAARIMALKGAEILIYPTAIGWGTTTPADAKSKELDSWITVMRSHSICNNIHTIAVNRVGTEGPLHFWGHSFVCAPDGELYNKPTEEEETFQTEIDLNKNKEHREVWTFFRDRRPDQYSDILAKDEKKNNINKE